MNEYTTPGSGENGKKFVVSRFLTVTHRVVYFTSSNVFEKKDFLVFLLLIDNDFIIYVEASLFERIP